MDRDLDMLEEALTYFARLQSRPKAWELTQAQAGIKIDRPSAYLLSLVCDTNCGDKLQDLAAKIGIEAPSVTRAVHRLEQANYVTRHIDETDGRIVRIQPTRQGIALIRRLHRAKREQLRQLLSSWPAAERHRLAQLLRKLAHSASELGEATSDRTIAKLATN